LDQQKDLMRPSRLDAEQVHLKSGGWLSREPSAGFVAGTNCVNGSNGQSARLQQAAGLLLLRHSFLDNRNPKDSDPVFARRIRKLETIQNVMNLLE